MTPSPAAADLTATIPGRTLAVFLSGTGRSLENLIGRIRDGRLRAAISLVVASRPCKGEEIARAAGIATVVLGKRSPDVEPEEDGRALARLLGAHRVDWVVLAGYLRLLPVPPGFEGRVLNIHPALLPRFGGKGLYGHHVHDAVLASGDAESGCTVHLCDDVYDRGTILVQRRCPVYPGDTADALAGRVFALECETYPEALEMVMSMAEARDGNSGRSAGV